MEAMAAATAAAVLTSTATKEAIMKIVAAVMEIAPAETAQTVMEQPTLRMVVRTKMHLPATAERALDPLMMPKRPNQDGASIFGWTRRRKRKRKRKTLLERPRRNMKLKRPNEMARYRL